MYLDLTHLHPFVALEALQILNLNTSQSKWSIDEVKKAYHIKAMETHPDITGDEKEFLKVKKAYETLTNPSAVKIEEIPIIKIPINFYNALFGKIIDVNLAIPAPTPSFIETPIEDAPIAFYKTLHIKVPPGSLNGYKFIDKQDDQTNYIEFIVKEVPRNIAIIYNSLDNYWTYQINFSLDVETIVEGTTLDIATPLGICSFTTQPKQRHIQLMNLGPPRQNKAGYCLIELIPIW